MAGVNATETGNEVSQLTLEFTSLTMMEMEIEGMGRVRVGGLYGAEGGEAIFDSRATHKRGGHSLAVKGPASLSC